MTPNSNTNDVLIADDDVDDYMMFEMAIQEIAVPVSLRHAKDGEMLFQKLKEAIPHLLFLDIQMPCKDGIACILEIRKDPRYNYLPVIMYTSFNHRPYIEDSYKNGANYYMIKPQTIKALREKLETIFEKQWHMQLYIPPMHEFVMS